MKRMAAAIGLVLLAAAAQGQSYDPADCTEDCSGHDAGYEWAEENDIDDTSDCDGNSNSFNEGCEAYVEENEEEDEEE